MSMDLVLDQEEGDHIGRMLEARHELRIDWDRLQPACGPEGNVLTAYVTMKASVHDCINIQRMVEKEAGRETSGQDGKFLRDFISAHWHRNIRFDARSVQQMRTRRNAQKPNEEASQEEGQ